MTFEEQAGLLISRGLDADPERLARKLSSVNYYRLSAYCLPFCEAEHQFRPGTTFDSIWSLYDFDRKLRLHIMDALERIEVAIRTRLAYHLAHRSGPFGYVNEIWPGNQREWARFFGDMEKELSKSRETFIAHFRSRYSDQHKYPPIWVASEILTFGGTVSLFRGAPRDVQNDVANVFGLSAKVMKSWLLCLNTVRNICAHHGRMWNRVLGIKPMLPRAAQYPEWKHIAPVANDRVFIALTMLSHMVYAIMPRSGWSQRTRELLVGYPQVDLKAMGFPERWEEHPVWARMLLSSE